MFLSRLHRRLLRTPVLVLLMLAMVIGPTLAGVGELHGVEHAAEAASDADHGHSHSGGHHHGHAPAEPDPAADPKHASGAHGLMHQAGVVAEILPETLLVVAMPPMAAPLPPDFAWFHLPGDSPTHPFRPPIA